MAKLGDLTFKARILWVNGPADMIEGFSPRESIPAPTDEAMAAVRDFVSASLCGRTGVARSLVDVAADALASLEREATARASVQPAFARARLCVEYRRLAAGDRDRTIPHTPRLSPTALARLGGNRSIGRDMDWDDPDEVGT